MTTRLSQKDVMAAYNHPCVATLRESLKDIYTPEEFGLWLALPQLLLNGRSALQMIHDGRCEEVIALVAQLETGAYV